MDFDIIISIRELTVHSAYKCSLKVVTLLRCILQVTNVPTNFNRPTFPDRPLHLELAVPPTVIQEQEVRIIMVFEWDSTRRQLSTLYQQPHQN